MILGTITYCLQPRRSEPSTRQTAMPHTTSWSTRNLLIQICFLCYKVQNGLFQAKVQIASTQQTCTRTRINARKYGSHRSKKCETYNKTVEKVSWQSFKCTNPLFTTSVIFPICLATKYFRLDNNIQK